MGLLGTIKHKVMSFKVIIMRVAGYLALMNTFMILFLTLSKIKDAGYISFDLGTYIIPIYILMIVCIAIFGYWEMYIWRLYDEETKINYKLSPSHPDVQDIKAKVDWLVEQEKKRCIS